MHALSALRTIRAAAWRASPCSAGLRGQCLGVRAHEWRQTWPRHEPGAALGPPLHRPYVTVVKKRPATPLRLDQRQQGVLKTVSAYATAEAYDMKRLLLEEGQVAWHPLGPDTCHTTYEGCDVYAFSSGCFVTWGLSREQAEAFMAKELRAASAASAPIEHGRYAVPETEMLDYHTSTEHAGIQVHGDIVSVGTTDETSPLAAASPEEVLARMAVSHGLARSVKLAELETMLDEFLESVEDVPHTIRTTGRIPLKRGEIISKIGTLLQLRQSLNLNEDTNFLDLPELYWDHPELERYYQDVSRSLSIAQRLSICNQKISYASDVQDTLRQVLNENTSHRLEWVIIWLIAVEVAILVVEKVA